MNRQRDGEIKHNILEIQQNIISLAKVYKVAEPTLLAVTKKQSISDIVAAYHSGLRQFAESYVQEAIEKIHALPKDITWHYIGHIQSNKLKVIAEHFNWVHTLSNTKHAQKLNQFCQDKSKHMSVCLQINVDQEKQKQGIDIANLSGIEALLDCIIQHCPFLKLEGLMCILAHSGEQTQQLNSFLRLKELKNDLTKKFNYPLNTLSIGMSSDINAAIEAGSTMLRIGQAIFGER